ncbi:TraB/GumN family protein [Novosphingobium colocasiae]|uniref:TraB/GumN family protein n=1 Tax=Novosphingobium colocasiae TaxID=1256513 RepID=UPI0035ADAE7C
MTMTTSIRRLCAMALGAFALLTSSCSERPAAVPTVAAPAPVVAPALWRVRDADTTIYLFGTVHVLPAPVDWNRGRIAAALMASSVLVTEANTDDQATLQRAFMAKGTRTDGKLLRDTMTPEARARYEAAMRGLGLPEAAFDPLKAWLPAVFLPVETLRRAGYSPESGVETQLVAIAKARGMARDALETPESQLDAFDSIPPQVQIAYLDEVVSQLPEATSVVGRMVDAWKAGKVDELARVINDDEDNPDVRAALLTRRNGNWAQWIKARMAQPGTVFVAVGAGHLGGPDSVQTQLARLHVRVSRVQ